MPARWPKQLCSARFASRLAYFCPNPAELLTGIEGASSRPVRRIVLITDPMLRAAELRRR